MSLQPPPPGEDRLPPIPGSGEEFTLRQRELLRRVGIDPDRRITEEELEDLRETSRARLDELLADALSVAEAAARLGVPTSRILERLDRRELLGHRRGDEWRLPALQFAGDGLIPHLDLVNRVRPETLHLLSYAGWLEQPHSELSLDEDTTDVSPLAWLAAGGDPDVVIPLIPSS